MGAGCMWEQEGARTKKPKNPQNPTFLMTSDMTFQHRKKLE
jgi:hypothetical protein